MKFLTPISFISSLVLLPELTNARRQLRSANRTNSVTNESASGSSSAVAPSKIVANEKPSIDEKHRFEKACKENEKLFKIEITTDNYGFETSWSLQQRTGGVWGEILSGPPEEINAYTGNTSYKDTMCLSGGNKYRLIIRDRFFDGFCCSVGEGTYSYFLDGELQYDSDKKRTFTDEAKHVFTVELPDDTADTATATAPATATAESSNFRFGDLAKHDGLGIQLSAGLSVKLIAVTGRSVIYGNGDQSAIRYHDAMDGAGIISLPDGGYAYVSNKERNSGRGGVYALYFDKNGDVVDYRELLTGTSRNCGGGITPWNTWVSCEEVPGGQCWQVDPDPSSENHGKPRQTVLGGTYGGEFETVAVDNKNPNSPVFFVTEDYSNGAVRRFVANGKGWDALHRDGITTYLRIIDGSTFEWTSSEKEGRDSASKHFQGSEGIDFHDDKLYFTAKTAMKFFILDLTAMTYTVERTQFSAQPDQIALAKNMKSLGTDHKYVYFCQDGGTPGVYARDLQGTYHTVFQAIKGGWYDGDETVGIALSPNGKTLYAGFQDRGVLMEFKRDDGLPFE